MTKIYAPFTPAQVAALNDWQKNPQVHPFTCGNDRHDQAHQLYASRYGRELGSLVAHLDGWKCPSCDYYQLWAFAFMVDDV